MTSLLGAGSECSHIRSSGCLIKVGFTAASFCLKLKKTRRWPAGVCLSAWSSMSLWVSVLDWILVRCSLKGTSCFFLLSPWITSTFPPWSSLVTQDSCSVGTGISFVSVTVDKTGNCKGIVDPKKKIRSSFTYPHVGSNLNGFLFSVEHRRTLVSKQVWIPLTSIVWTKKTIKSIGPETIWSPTFFKISSFVIQRFLGQRTLKSLLQAVIFWSNETSICCGRLKAAEPHRSGTCFKAHIT